MKKIITVIFLSFNLGFIIPVFASSKDIAQNAVFQMATISSLTQGVYDGNFNYRNLMKHGNFGVGTFLDLNGEMVALDGRFYQKTSYF